MAQLSQLKKKMSVAMAKKGVDSVDAEPKAPDAGEKADQTKDVEEEGVNEYIVGHKETVSQAFKKAGIDMSRPVVVVTLSDGPGGSIENPRKEDPKQLMDRLEKLRSKSDPQQEGVWYEYGDEIDASGMGVTKHKPKLTVNFSDTGGDFIFQGGATQKEGIETEALSVSNLSNVPPAFLTKVLADLRLIQTKFPALAKDPERLQDIRTIEKALGVPPTNR